MEVYFPHLRTNTNDKITFFRVTQNDFFDNKNKKGT